jgi:IclR family transcriptional regulator, pca regulon regulatory protein
MPRELDRENHRTYVRIANKSQRGLSVPKLKRDAAEDAGHAGAEFIESLHRGLRVIELLGADRRPMTLSDVAKAADLPRATARRILMTLERTGYVEGDGRLFALTPRVLSLASAYLASNQIVAVMQPMMDRVSDQTREVCSLAILEGEQVMFIARASPARLFSGGLDIGYRLPAFCTSVGRVLLGRLSAAALTAAVGGMKLVQQTPFTVIDKDVVTAAIITDRNKGYSLVDREAEDGFRSIAVPVRRYDGEIVAAINVGAHIDRISPGEMIDRFLPPLTKAAESARPLLV